MTRIFLVAALVIFTIFSNVKARERLLIFAAASLKNALEVAGGEFQRDCDCVVVFSFAGTPTLARQINAGAPADIFISADLKWMDWLEKPKAILPQSRQIIAGNRLVVAVSADLSGASNNSDQAKTADNSVLSVLQLAELLKGHRIAMAHPDYVPAGRYGRQALEKLNLWAQLSNRVVFGENVRLSLALVARGDVGAAIVYHSDARIEPRVKIAYLFASDSHEPIIYPAALVKNNALGTKFMQFLKSERMHQIFADFGFSVRGDE